MAAWMESTQAAIVRPLVASQSLTATSRPLPTVSRVVV